MLGVRYGGAGGAAAPASSSPPPQLLRVEQVVVQGGADANTQLTVSWAVPASSAVSAAAAGTASIFQYSVPGGAPASAPVTCSQYTLGADASYGAYTSPYLCFAAATVPAAAQGTRVSYRAGDAASGYATGVTATAPQPGVPGARLAVLGDLGTTADSAATLAGIGAGGPFAALLFLGDLSYADGNQTVFDEWGRLFSPLGATLPTYFLPGNHVRKGSLRAAQPRRTTPSYLTVTPPPPFSQQEWFDLEREPCDYTRPPYCNYTFQSYLARVHSPSASGAPTADTLYYSTNIGMMHVVMLQGYCTAMKTTREQPCLAQGSAQLLWLQEDLRRVNRTATPWVLVGFHQPYVNSNVAHSRATEGAPMQAAVEDALNAGGVDLVLSGHVHAVERSCKTYNYTCVPDGPVYVTVGDGGNREGLAAKWVEPQPPYSLFRQASFGHGEVEATNATHLLWTWRQNGALYPSVGDTAWIVKGQQGAVGPGVTRTPVRRALRE